jgi:hypothetical protein
VHPRAVSPLRNIVSAIIEHSGILKAIKEPVERWATDTKAFSQLAFCPNESTFHRFVSNV